GRSEITPEHAAEIVEVLHEQRSVEARLVHALCELLCRQPSAESSGDGVAGEPHQEEHHGDQYEDRGNDEYESEQNVAPQSSPGWRCPLCDDGCGCGHAKYL